MSVRNTIVNSLITHISNSTNMYGHRGLKFLHEINDFPSFYVHVANESRTHIGGRMKLCIISCDLRVYVHSDLIDDIEIAVRSIEEAIDSFTSDCLADDIRVTSVRTDEGLAIPYQNGDMTFQILYRIEQ